MADNAVRAGLKAAADSFARRMRVVAATRTRRAAAAVHTAWSSANSISVLAGTDIGPYGWEPITALMFDDDLRHPLFGNKRHWYFQAYKKGGLAITEITEQTGIEDATEAFADAAFEVLIAKYGYEDK
jgi:hypothetical protein